MLQAADVQPLLHSGIIVDHTVTILCIYHLNDDCSEFFVLLVINVDARNQWDIPLHKDDEHTLYL